jgi:hypothetical protein
MSDDHSHSVPQSTPVRGHEGTSYEANDAKPGLIIWSLGIIAALAALGFILMVGAQKYLQDTHPRGQLASPLAPYRLYPSAPQLQVHPWEDLPEMHADEAKILEFSGRDKAGRMHIPIEAAMTEILPRLKVDPNAPKGLTTPGGQGIEYSHELNETRGNERPMIQGEIRKNAQ